MKPSLERAYRSPNKIRHFKLTSPDGKHLAKETYKEEELRKFAPTLIENPDQIEFWRATVAKHDIEFVVDWLQQIGWKVIEVV